MKRKNMTRNALVSSIISLLLCVSMLVGTTFAWFTDEVVSGMNTISAGNLDVELVHTNAKVADENVAGNTDMFLDVNGEKILWEPGVVAYEGLTVKNVGTLALKYRMTLNFGSENNLNGHKLSEVLKVAVIDETKVNLSDRASVLAAAKAVVAAGKSDGSLSNFYLTGELLPGESSAKQTIVIFWEPNDNAIDNLYNANNGQVTSDGEPLHIEFGINLQATQMMYEEDSFDNTYDGDAAFLPQAIVNNQGIKTVSATNGIGGSVSEYELPFTLQFLPNEKLSAGEDQIEGTADDYLESEYRLWHADYVVKADRDVPADSIALLGYYDAWCQYNNDNWVAMINVDTDIAANTEIRLVELLGATVNYEEICRYGNDPEDKLPADLEGFLCGATDLTGENAGTTITVELRMYEVPAKGECAIGGGCNHPNISCESGEYKVAGVYSYTFGAKNVATADELAAMLTSGDDDIQVTLANDIDLPITSLGSITGGSGEYKLGGEGTNAITIDLNGHRLNITTTYWSAIGAKNADVKITIKNGTVTSTGNSAGTWNAWDLRFSNCNWDFENVVFEKAVALDNAGKVTNMKNVTITDSHNTDTYALWITTEGQTVNIDGLTIDMLAASDGRGIKIDNQYVDASSKVSLNISNATFKTEEKSAILVKSPAGADITLSNVNIANVAADSTNPVWVDSDASAYADLVTVTGGSVIAEP